jgi:hypothetical protein
VTYFQSGFKLRQINNQKLKILESDCLAASYLAHKHLITFLPLPNLQTYWSPMKTKLVTTLVAASAAVFCAGAQADTGKLLLTGGVSSIDGAAGGGLTPWAVIGSNATDGEIGGSAYISNLGTKDYGFNFYGAAVGINDRFELSIAQQDMDTRATGTALGVPGLRLKQTILGAKIKVAGDAILDSDTLMQNAGGQRLERHA